MFCYNREQPNLTKMTLSVFVDRGYSNKIAHCGFCAGRIRADNYVTL